MKNKQQEQDWLQARLKIVGASEIATVIKSECTEEEIKEAMGGFADDFIKDKTFVSPFCLFNYKKERAKPPYFPIELSKFGHEMEKFICKFINTNCGEYIKATCQPQESITCPEFHKLASYTPDLFIELKKDYEFNANTIIKRFGKPIFAKANEKSVGEVKTINIYKFNKDNSEVQEGQEEVMPKYIVQNQSQIIIQNKKDSSFKYGIVGCAVAYEPKYDTLYYKGRAVELCRNLTKENFEKLCGWYEVKLWIYPIYKTVEKIILKSLDRWAKRLQNDSEPKSDFENEKDNAIQKDRLKNSFEYIKIVSQRDLGADLKGIIKMTTELQKKYQNLSDKLKIDKSNREDLISSKKAIEKIKAEFIDICLNVPCLGFDFEDFTVHLSKGKGGAITFRNNFKTTDESLRGMVKVKDEIKPEVGVESFM